MISWADDMVLRERPRWSLKPLRRRDLSRSTTGSVGGSGADGALENPPPGGSPTHRNTYREAS